MLGDAAERAEAGLGLGVLLRTTDCSAAANAGDDMRGGDFRDGDLRGADGVEGNNMEDRGGGGGGGGGAGENGLAAAMDASWATFVKCIP